MHHTPCTCARVSITLFFFSNATISGEFGVAKKKIGKTGIPDAVRATNRILSICFCYCPENVLDIFRDHMGLVLPMTM